MTAAELIPFEELALNAEAAGKILGCAPRTVLEEHACKPGFPPRISHRPATWRAGDILAYRDAERDANRAGRRVRRR